jgi:transposase
LDGSVKGSAICIVDEDGRICREFKAISDPEDISRALNGVGVWFERIGLEAGPLSHWLFEGQDRPAGDLHRDPPPQGFPQGAGEQDRPQ